MLDQLRQFGAPAEVLRAAEQRLKAEADAVTLPVWPENWHAVNLFLALATQWHWVAPWRLPAQRTGLRLDAVPTVLPMVRRAVPARHRQPYAVLLRQLQAMEDAVLEEQAAKLLH